MMILFIIFCFILQFNDLEGFVCSSLSRNNYTCSSCIQLHPSCSWCSNNTLGANRYGAQCESREKLLAIGCPEHQIFSPQTETILTKNLPLTDQEQLQPQHISLKVRPKERVSFNVTYRQPKDYPVDLYYLMDLSFSMRPSKEILQTLGSEIASKMRSLTSDFRLGFGSFVDKSVVPLIKYGSALCKVCEVGPYGFQHHLSLTEDESKFSHGVKESKLSGNNDFPEGGLEALVQAIVCQKAVGWRKNARRMIVYASDGSFHFAGDGRVAGIVEPNDGKCHLNANGTYTKADEQDYPSVDLIHDLIKEHQINMIWAILGTASKYYQPLSEMYPDISSSIAVPNNDSSNIVDIIRNEYLTISQKVRMVDNSRPSDGVSISYRSKCTPGGPLTDGQVCENVTVGQEVQYEVSLEVPSCTANRNLQLEIGPVGIHDRLRVDVEVICSCGCESSATKTPWCGGNLEECGACVCATGSGRQCQCQTEASDEMLIHQCKRTNNSDVCEGRGICNCGTCECRSRPNDYEEISGKFCECDNFNCPRHEKRVCSDNGRCDCGNCACNNGWTGRACECPTSVASCLSPNGKVCNGHGTCLCGRCQCDVPKEEEHRYTGSRCEICQNCPQRCVDLRPCVQCQQFKTGPYNSTTCEQCPFNVIPVDELPEAEGRVECHFIDRHDNCTFYFLYEGDEDDNLTVWVRKEKDCPALIPLAAWVAGSLCIFIILLGLLLLLLWKLLTYLKDKAEYAKFQEDLSGMWDKGENPLYKQATTTFHNPAYHPSSNYKNLVDGGNKASISKNKVN